METVQLLCVGYAGSEAAAFHVLSSYLNEEILFSVIEYRGRGARSREAFYRDNDEMLRDVAVQIEQIRKPEIPFAILGYSMGAQVVYELFARGLLKESPVCVFLAAHEPPDVDCFGKSVAMEDDTVFLRQLQKYGGIDERLMENRRFREIYLPRMKADYRLLKEYRFSGTYDKIPSKVVICYCEKDTPYERMRGWERFAEKEISFYEMGQNHFFFKSEPEKFCEIIKKGIEG